MTSVTFDQSVCTAMEGLYVDPNTASRMPTIPDEEEDEHDTLSIASTSSVITDQTLDRSDISIQKQVAPGEVKEIQDKHGRRKKKHVQTEEEQLIDSRDPKVNLFQMIPIIGIEGLPLLLGCVASMAQGVIPLVFYWVLGNLIGDLATATVGQVR